MSYPYGEFGGNAGFGGGYAGTYETPRTEQYSIPGSGELLAGAAESIDAAIAHLTEGATHLAEAEQTSRETHASITRTLEGSSREGELEEWVYGPLRLTGDKAYDRTTAFNGLVTELTRIRSELGAA